MRQFGQNANKLGHHLATALKEIREAENPTQGQLSFEPFEYKTATYADSRTMKIKALKLL